MKCFICEKDIAPVNGYFQTQLWNNKLMCHIPCQPKFYFSTASAEIDPGCLQRELFIKGVVDEKTVQPSNS